MTARQSRAKVLAARARKLVHDSALLKHASQQLIDASHVLGFSSDDQIRDNRQMRGDPKKRNSAPADAAKVE